MKRLGGALVTAALLMTGLVVAPPARAAFHLMEIVEVFAGWDVAPDAQFVELQMTEDGQSFVQGHSVTFYNAAGELVNTETFSSNVANGDQSASILIATEEAKSAFAINAELVMDPPSITPDGGKVCWAGFECVEWGPVAISSGSSAHFTASGTSSLASPTPRNNLGQAGTIQKLVGFPQANYEIAEDAAGNAATISVGRTFTSGSASYATADGSATVTEDYSSSSGALSFPPDGLTTTFSVPIIDDIDVDGDETVLLTLSSPSDGALLGRATATLTIVDNDGPPTIRFASATATHDESDGTVLVDVLRGGNSSGEVGATVSRTGGSAAPSVDFTDGAGTVTFAAADSQESLMLTITNDALDESDETIELALESPTGTGTTIGSPSTMTVTITDDDDVAVDNVRPKSSVTKPAHKARYPRSRLKVVSGTASDSGGSGLALVQAALRMTMTNGKCKWFNGTRFVARRCGAKLWKSATGTATWKWRLGGFRLASSRASKVKHYTAFSRARDGAGNLQLTPDANRFEIR